MRTALRCRAGRAVARAGRGLRGAAGRRRRREDRAARVLRLAPAGRAGARARVAAGALRRRRGAGRRAAAARGAGGASAAAPRELVIDPLIDASTGQQTAARCRWAAARRADQEPDCRYWSVRPLTRNSLSDQPLLLIGTLTAINTKGVRDENADAFRVCLVLIDLRTGKLVAKRVDRATVDDGRPPSRRRSSATARPGRSTARPSPTSSRARAASPGDTRRSRRTCCACPRRRSSTRRRLAFAENKRAEAYRLFQRGPADRRPRRPAHPQRPLPHQLAHRQEEGGDRDLRPDRRHRPRRARSCRSRSSSTPGRRPCSPRPTCRRSTRSGCARWRSRSACARPA